MKVSTKGRYGLKAMVYIATNSSDNSCVSLRCISEKEGISENYLEQIIAQLKKHKLLKSVRGANGGYILSREASKISVGEILRALEGSLAPVDCVNGDDNKSCNCGTSCSDGCSTKDVWQKIYDSISETIDNIYLESLITEEKTI